jgi:serine/threonine-protein kinase PknG
MTKCPVCDSDVKTDATQCGACGAAITAAEVLASLKTSTPPPAPGPKQGDTCEVCQSGKLKKLDDNTFHCDTCGATPAAPSEAIDAGVVAEEEEDTSATGSRGASVSGRLAGLTVHGSTTKTVLAANLEASGIRIRPTRNVNRNGSRSVTFSTLGCGIINIEPQIPADPQTMLKKIDQVSIPKEKRFCENEQCIGDPDTPLDWNQPLLIKFNARGLTDAAVDKLFGLGVEVETIDQGNRQILGTVPADKLDEVRAMSGIVAVEAVYHAHTKLEDDHCFCPWCGQEYWFVPNLKVGEVIAGQYEVRGYIARGGFGIIYLAWDREVGRFVTLKAVANANDPVAVKAAVDEKRGLAELDHPNIVKIYGFKEHQGVSYIVMQYVNGVSLKNVLKERRDKKMGPLPATIALSYVQGILNAFDYLQRKGYVYRDFKPDNLMLVGDTVILIDLGALVKEQDQVQDIGGRLSIMPVQFTLGYNPPETVAVDQKGLNKFGEPVKFTYSSDRYTLMRSLAVMAVDFKFKREPYLYAVPEADKIKLFRRHPSFHRLLLKGLRENQDERFQSIPEMGEAIVGVLREMKCIEDWLDKDNTNRTIHPRHVESAYFMPDTFDGSHEFGWKDLPSLRPDPRDKAASFITGLIGMSPSRQVEMLQKASDQFPKSWEFKLRLGSALIELGQYPSAQQALDDLTKEDPYDWRISWTRMLGCFAQGKFADARDLAEAVYCELPGELAPKVARALASELAGDHESAIALYNLVSVCDNQWPSAVFGLARTTLAQKKGSDTGARDTAAEVFNRVPLTSIAYNQAMIQLARTLCSIEPSELELQEAARHLADLRLEGYQYHRVRADVLIAAISRLESGKLKPKSEIKLFDTPFIADSLRAAAEKELRNAATAVKARDSSLHVRLVVEANQVKPWN